MVIWRKADRAMAKNLRKKGRSAKNGNAPSPYTKYDKVPYKYSTAYHTWRTGRLAGRIQSAVSDDKFRNRKYDRVLEAAE